MKFLYCKQIRRENRAEKVGLEERDRDRQADSAFKLGLTTKSASCALNV